MVTLENKILTIKTKECRIFNRIKCIISKQKIEGEKFNVI